ncbi:hypothetical protein SEUBUCD646_0G00240 [Saccharomyces eubayanus]|uniref:Uncharacterized protein n=1 Tax=Saccharomyces eubayanus TaxID=1080349 RepID=A0ABN8VYP5_SACEU|nr:hypothetical protein SEUBUCD650_0G00250 [Saccharomyces eubayanus]CAI2006259.1 hypothetical protein SEUBUCD646_0G00240 [Saccharomyces eubayanus]
MLAEWLDFGSIGQVYYNCMNNRSVHIEDYPHNSKRSVFDIVDQNLVSPYSMNWKKIDYKNDKIIRDAVLKIANRITKLLMIAIGVCPGLPLVFPELNLLRFTSFNRNMYFDAGERVFVIESKYNKYNTQFLFLDVPVSAILFWFMYILRLFTISMYPVDVGCSERAEIVSTIGSVVADNVLGNNRFDDNNIEMNDEERAVNADVYEYTIMLEAFIKKLEANKIRDIMLKDFLFIDTSNCGLMKRTHFSTVLSTYPTSISNRQAQNLTSFQRGLAAL